MEPLAIDLWTFDVGAEAATAVAAAKALESYQIETYGEGVRLFVEDGAVAIPQILRRLDAAGVPLGTVELHRPSLDDVFLTKTGRSLRES